MWAIDRVRRTGRLGCPAPRSRPAEVQVAARCRRRAPSRSPRRWLSPTSPMTRSPVARSNENRHGLRRPYDQTSAGGLPAARAAGGRVECAGSCRAASSGSGALSPIVPPSPVLDVQDAVAARTAAGRRCGTGGAGVRERQELAPGRRVGARSGSAERWNSSIFRAPVPPSAVEDVEAAVARVVGRERHRQQAALVVVAVDASPAGRGTSPPPTSWMTPAFSTTNTRCVVGRRRDVERAVEVADVDERGAAAAGAASASMSASGRRTARISGPRPGRRRARAAARSASQAVMPPSIE